MSEHDDDRRKHPRIAIDLWADEHHGSATYYQHVADLSLGGVFIPGTISHPAGTEVRLELQLPDGAPPASVRCVVVGADSETTGMRLSFLDLDEDTRARIGRFLDLHAG
jgi:hypothetical protein